MIGVTGESYESKTLETHDYHIILVFVGLAAFLAVTARVHTEPFRDVKGNIVPGSVTVMEKHTIGGLPQMLWLRGVSVTNPMLIVLHGGPGASEATVFRHYNSELEQHFLVVYWEQRGAGRSFYPNLPSETMTITAVCE